LLVGAVQYGLARGRSAQGSKLAVFPAVAAMAGLGEWRRRRAEHLDGVGEEPAAAARAKSTGLGIGVAAVSMLASAGERRLADRVASGASRVFGGHPAWWRPLGHAVSLALVAGATRGVMHQAFRRIEHMEESVEPALDVPPPLATVSGSLDSVVPFDTLARAGRRFVWTPSTTDRIEEVMGEPAVRVPARAYVGLESADSDEARVRLDAAQYEIEDARQVAERARVLEERVRAVAEDARGVAEEARAAAEAARAVAEHARAEAELAREEAAQNRRKLETQARAIARLQARLRDR